MRKSEFYWEYLKECDKLVSKFLADCKNRNKEVFCIDHINIEKAIANFLWENLFFSENKEKYSLKRKQGKDCKALIESIRQKCLKPYLPQKKQTINNRIINKYKTPYIKILKEYRNIPLFLCKNDRQLSYFIPFLRKIRRKVIILTLSEIDETIISKENIEIVEYGIIAKPLMIEQSYLKEKFTYLFFLANTFYLLIKGIMPSLVFVMEGCHFETEVLSAVSKIFSIKTICIQQGWPGLMHTRFKDMTYDYFLTWGRGFSKLWKKYNSHPVFIESGYLYPVDASRNEKKKNITFFFQAPIFIINQRIFKDMINFSIYCAKTFPNKRILIREHPEYKWTTAFKSYPAYELHLI